MIETEQTVVIEAAIADVWTYVADIQRWAALMPGMRECEVIDANDSKWTIKVGVGGLVRTVRVEVHVDQWDGPSHVFFSYKLDGDPVQGGGTYVAKPLGPNQTEVALRVRVEGGGPMAPMWEAMGKPLLPQLAKGFANQLKTEIERIHAPAAAAAGKERSPFPRWLRAIWRTLFGRREAA
jgi:carbon monoxide dehydrogenase subunit G